MNSCLLDRCMLIIFASPAVEETMVDWLLENDSITAFSTAHGFGHGSRPSSMSLIEQVAGRQKKVEFKVETSLAVARALVEEIRKKFHGAGLHYILVPILESGQL